MLHGRKARTFGLAAGRLALTLVTILALACPTFARGLTLGRTAAAAATNDAQVTIIVELDAEPQLASVASEDDTAAGESNTAAAEARHASVKDSIRALVAEDAGEADQDGISLQSDDELVEEVYDYYHALDGFAIKAPASALSAIRQLDGVKHAFIEQAYEVTVDQGDDGELDDAALDGSDAELAGMAIDDGGAELADDDDTEPADDGDTPKNQTALDATRADQVSQSGEGQLIAVIDEALDTDHEVFSGDIPDETLALAESRVEDLASNGELCAAGAAWVSEKIPFVYDYADWDADVNPALADFDHGTHVAGSAVANAGEIRGTAPDAQLAFMKVAYDEDGSMYDGDILAALDDCAVIRPDVVNMSFGTAAGFGDEGNETYADAISALEGLGIIVNAAACNDGSYGTYNQSGKHLPYATDPDDSMVGSPASTSGTLAVACSGPSSASESIPRAYSRMTSWSSRGVTPDLKLKPEITAPGENIYSSVPDGYGYNSGTSMATPQILGITALLREYVEEDEKFSGLSDTEKADAITQLLMCTATLLVDITDSSSYYSPRSQGAGQANVVAATSTDVYVTVEDADNPSRPKADLGESEDGSYSFTVTLHNLGSAVHSYTFDAAALSEKVEDGLFQLHSKNWTGEGITVTADASTVEVPAGGTASVTVSIRAEEAFADWAAENTPNGTFIDGFVMFKAAGGDEGAVDLSVPFMGFYGDWSDAPALDAAAADDENAYHSYGTALLNDETYAYLGTNPLDEIAADDESAIDLDKIVLSSSEHEGAPTSLTPFTGLLRNVGMLSYTLGDVITEDNTLSYCHVSKTYFNEAEKTWMYAELTGDIDGTPTFFMGEGDGPETTFTITATTSGPTPEEQSLSFTIHYDCTSPTIVSSVYNEGDEPSVTFTVEDDTFLAAIDFVDPSVEDVTVDTGFYRVLVDPDEALVETKADGTKVYEVTVPVADIAAAWGTDDLPDAVAAYAWDYGLNLSEGAEAALCASEPEEAAESVAPTGRVTTASKKSALPATSDTTSAPGAALIVLAAAACAFLLACLLRRASL